MHQSTRRKKQLEFFESRRSDYGGSLLKKRKGRSGPRPISTRFSMHLVLRSSKAVGIFSFKKHRRAIQSILERFSKRHGIEILSLVNVGNHLHIRIKVGNRFGYTPFIRAISAAIMMAVTGVSRWQSSKIEGRFWDLRPFTRICRSWRELTQLNRYFKINYFESMGYTKQQARFLVEWDEAAVYSSA